MNSTLLREEIDKSGLRPGYIIERMGMSRQLFNMKQSGKVAFSLDEANALRQTINMPWSTFRRIFFEDDAT